MFGMYVLNSVFDHDANLIALKLGLQSVCKFLQGFAQLLQVFGLQELKTLPQQMFARGHQERAYCLTLRSEDDTDITAVACLPAPAFRQPIFFKLVDDTGHIALITDQQLGQFAQRAPFFLLEMDKCPVLGQVQAESLHELPFSLIHFEKGLREKRCDVLLQFKTLFFNLLHWLSYCWIITYWLLRAYLFAGALSIHWMSFIHRMCCTAISGFLYRAGERVKACPALSPVARQRRLLVRSGHRASRHGVPAGQSVHRARDEPR